MKKIFILLSATVLTIGCGNGYDSIDAQEFAEALKNPDLQMDGLDKDRHIPHETNPKASSPSRRW